MYTCQLEQLWFNGDLMGFLKEERPAVTPIWHVLANLLKIRVLGATYDWFLCRKALPQPWKRFRISKGSIKSVFASFWKRFRVKKSLRNQKLSKIWPCTWLWHRQNTKIIKNPRKIFENPKTYVGVRKTSNSELLTPSELGDSSTGKKLHFFFRYCDGWALAL